MKKSSLDEIAGFNASNWRTPVRFGRIRYRIRAEGVAAIKLAVKLLRLSEENRPLVALRNEIRAVRKTQCKAALTHMIHVTESEQLRLIGIWLRGQCGGYLGKEVLAKLSTHASEAVRLKVARALQRMSCWSVLRQMSVNDSSPRVRRLASSREPRDFRTRLNRFVDNSQPYSVALKDVPGRRDLFIANDFEFATPMNLKSVEFIRAMLVRIRFLVRGEVCDDRVPEGRVGAR